MEISYPPALIPSLKNKHLLLDTNILRDAANNSNDFNNFFNTLKKSEITLTTIDFVCYEFLKGSLNESKLDSRKKLLNQIIDTTIPILLDTYNKAYDLISDYGIHGASLHITDLMLGAILTQYKKNIFLITRDTTDFLQSIFNLSFIVNATHNKGIFTYGVYQYQK